MAMLHKYRVAFLAVGALVLLTANQLSHASLIVSAGETVVFNFDFREETPPPPYTSIVQSHFAIALSPGPILGAANLTLFSELNGQGYIRGVSGSGITNHLCCSFDLASDPSFMDGVFSVVLTISEGTWEVLRMAAAAETASGQTVTIDALELAIPEPSTVSLLGLAFSALLLQADRRARPSRRRTYSVGSWNARGAAS